MRSALGIMLALMATLATVASTAAQNRTLYYLPASELAKLHVGGVSLFVLHFKDGTPLCASLQGELMNDSGYDLTLQRWRITLTDRKTGEKLVSRVVDQRNASEIKSGSSEAASAGLLYISIDLLKRFDKGELDASITVEYAEGYMSSGR